MKPLEKNPLIKVVPEHVNAAINEIKAFANHECQCAELELFEGVSMQTSIERYNKAIRRLRIKGIELHRRKGKLIAVKNNLFEGGIK